jgi:hypothetical protein
MDSEKAPNRGRIRLKCAGSVPSLHLSFGRSDVNVSRVAKFTAGADLKKAVNRGG